LHLLDEQLEFLDRILVGYGVITELSDPSEAELLAAVFDFAKRLVNEKRIDNTGPEKATPILLRIPRNFPVAGNKVCGLFGQLTAYGINDSALDTRAIKILHKLGKRSSDRIPLPDLIAFIAGTMELCVKHLRGFGIRGSSWAHGTGPWVWACGMLWNQRFAVLLPPGPPSGRSAVGQSPEEEKALLKESPAWRMMMN